MKINGHTFLISGGGSGLGAATARRLAAQGANVLIADINDAAGTLLCQELGANARYVHTDVRDEANVGQAVATTTAVFGALHGAVNCAGIATAEKTLSRRGPHTLTGFTNVVVVNLIGAFNVARLAAAAMADNPANPDGERGVIVNTASIAAYEGQVGQVAYAASKGGIVGMTLAMARDLAAYGIRVMTIAPGVFDTPLLAGLPAAARAALAAQIPFPPRLGQPDEYAALVTHIMENVMLNGEVIRLDGALRMPPQG